MSNINKSYTFALGFALITHGFKVTTLEHGNELGEGLVVDGAKFLVFGYEMPQHGVGIEDSRVLIRCVDTMGYQIVSNLDVVTGVAAVRRMLTDFKALKPEQPKVPDAVRDILDRLGFKDYQVVNMKMGSADLGNVKIENVVIDPAEITAEMVKDDFTREVANLFKRKSGPACTVMAYNRESGLLTITCNDNQFGIRVPKHRKYAEIYHYNTKLERRVPFDAELVYTQFGVMGGAVLADAASGTQMYTTVLPDLMERQFPQPVYVYEGPDDDDTDTPAAEADVVDDGVSPEDAFTFTTNYGSEDDCGYQEVHSHGFEISASWRRGPLGYHVEVVASKNGTKITGYDDFVASPIDCKCAKGTCVADYANEFLPHVIASAKQQYAALIN